MVLLAATTFNEVSIYLSSQLSGVPKVVIGSGPSEALCLDCTLVSCECFSIRDGFIHVFFPILKMITFVEHLVCVKHCAKYFK